MADVRPRAGDDEAGGEQLAAQPALRVEVLGVDVARVAGEAERQAGDARRVPGDRRGAVREVRVQVADVGRVEQAVGERDRLEQLLDVDLARAREAGAAVAQRLRAGRGERAGEAERAAARDAGDRGRERRQVGAAPAVQRLGQRRGVREVLGAGLDGVDHGVAEPLLALLDRLDDEQPQRDAGLLDAQQLAGDEGLGHAREAHEHVADGCGVRGHALLGHARNQVVTNP